VKVLAKGMDAGYNGIRDLCSEEVFSGNEFNFGGRKKTQRHIIMN
jgi:hypothetical protein